MTEIKTLDDIISKVQGLESKRIAVAAANDKHVLSAVKQAVDLNIVTPLLVGDEGEIRSICASIDFNLEGVTVIDASDPAMASKLAVKEIRAGRADILMKGMVSTAPLLKAVLNKEEGIRKRQVLSHFAIFQTSYYHKLLGVSDAAMNLAPDLSEKVAIVQNGVEVFHALGVDTPKVAVIGPVEVVNPKISSTLDAAALSLMAARGQIKSCLIDGPLAVDNAVSKEAAKQKKIESEVAGDADILLAHDLNSGNILYKTMIFLSDSKTAAVILGAKAPVVLTSRADSEETKLYSIALAALI